jgi:hypothetical protein
VSTTDLQSKPEQATQYSGFDLNRYQLELARFRDGKFITNLSEKFGIPGQEIVSVAEQAMFVGMGLPLNLNPEQNADSIASLVFASHEVDDICDARNLPLEIREHLIATLEKINFSDARDLDKSFGLLFASLDLAKARLGIKGIGLDEFMRNYILDSNSLEAYMQKLSYVKLLVAGLIQTNGLEDPRFQRKNKALKELFANCVNLIAGTNVYDLNDLPPEQCLVATGSGLLEMFAVTFPHSYTRGAKFEYWNQILGTMVYLNNSSSEDSALTDQFSINDFRKMIGGSWANLKKLYEQQGSLDFWDELEVFRFVQGFGLLSSGRGEHSFDNYPEILKDLKTDYEGIFSEITRTGMLPNELLKRLGR